MSCAPDYCTKCPLSKGRTAITMCRAHSLKSFALHYIELFYIYYIILHYFTSHHNDSQKSLSLHPAHCTLYTAQCAHTMHIKQCDLCTIQNFLSLLELYIAILCFAQSFHLLHCALCTEQVESLHTRHGRRILLLYFAELFMHSTSSTTVSNMLPLPLEFE